MKKTLRFSIMMLLSFICGSINAGTITFSELNLENGVQYSDPFDGSDFTVTFAGGGNDGKYYTTGTGIRVYGGGTMTIAAKSGNITKIVITYDGSNKPADGTVVDGGTYDAETGTWTGSATSVVFTRPSGSGHWRVQTVEATIAAGGSETKTATTIEFSGNYLTKFTPGKDGDKVDLPTAIVKAGDAAVEGAIVTWSLTKGSNWSADSDPAINGTKIEFGDHSCGDLILKASYEGDASYEGSTKNYTLKVYKGYMAIKSILEDYPEVGGDTWKAKEAEWKAGSPISYWQVEAKSETEFTSKEALVTYVNGQYTYIKDNDGCLLLYGSDLGFKQGDKISGDLGENQFGAIYGTLKAYNGLLELATSKNEIEFVVKSSDNAVEAKTITIDQLTQENMNEYVKIENAEFVSANNKNLTFKVGDVNVAVYNQFSVDVTTLEVGAVYSLYGMGCVYYKNETVTNQLYLVAFEKAPEELEVVEVEASCYVNENYLPGGNHDVTIDWDAIATALGCTSDALKIYAVLPDGTLDESYERGSMGTDGWRDAQGNWAGWNSADNIFYVQFSGLTLAGIGCMRTAEPIAYTAIFKVVDSANEDGDFVTLRVTLNVTEAPVVELTYEQLDIVGKSAVEVYSKIGESYEGMTEKADIDQIITTLGIQSLDDVTIYVVKSDGTLDMNYGLGSTDGWRNAAGEWSSWGNSATAFCIKADFAAAPAFYYIGGYHEGAHLTEAVTYQAKYVFVAGENTAFEFVLNLSYLSEEDYNIATGISVAETKKAQNDAIYNLAGQKVDKDYKGVIIVNGKKYLQK